MAPHGGERVFIKSAYSAFIGTTLEKAIRDAGVKELFIAGLILEHCVGTSTRMAADLEVVGVDGKIYLVGDGVASRARGSFDAETIHGVHLAGLEGAFAEVVDTKDVVQGAEEGKR